MKKIAVTILLSLLPAIAMAQSEAYYVEKLCEGDIEVRLKDGTRVDCLTEAHAIEVDFAHKWYQAIGQSLHYGRLTGKTPGIWLIVEEADDFRYVVRAQKAIKYYNLPIDISCHCEFLNE